MSPCIKHFGIVVWCIVIKFSGSYELIKWQPEGCRQIASCGGLEILSSLITGHFPAFSFPLPYSSHARNDSLLSKSSLTIYHCTNTPLTDQELDFLVAILGLLVNLVEKDGDTLTGTLFQLHLRPRLFARKVKLTGKMIPRKMITGNMIPDDITFLCLGTYQYFKFYISI